MSVVSGWTVEAVLAAFDEHLRRARGALCGYPRQLRPVGTCVLGGATSRTVQVRGGGIGASDVVGFIAAAIARYAAKDGGVGGDVAAFVLPVPARPGSGRGGPGGRGADGAAPPERTCPAPGRADPSSELIASLDTSSAAGVA